MPLFTFLLSLSELISPIHSLVSTSLSTSLTHEAQLILISLIHSSVCQARQRRRPIKLDSSSSTTSPKLPHSPPPISLIHHCHPPQTHAVTEALSILFTVIEVFFFFFFFLMYFHMGMVVVVAVVDFGYGSGGGWFWQWVCGFWLWWWWMILALVVVVDDFDSGFVDFGCGGGGWFWLWQWVLWILDMSFVVVVVMVGYLVVCGDRWWWGCDYGCGFVFVFIFFCFFISMLCCGCQSRVVVVAGGGDGGCGYSCGCGCGLVDGRGGGGWCSGRFFFFDCGIYYFIVGDILFYCDIYIILLC